MVNKRELLDNMWDKVADIKDGMSEIEENIYTISDCIDAKKFFAPEAAETVMKNLGKIEEASAYCKDNYEALSGEEFSFDEIESLEKSLKEIDILLNNQDEVEAAKRFLSLSCADEIARPYLTEEQEKLAGILGEDDSFTVARDLTRLAGLRPYARYLKAYDEKRMVSVLDYIAELRERFHDELVAALLDKQISEAKADAGEPEVEIPVESAEAEDAETAIPVETAEAEEAAEPEIPEPVDTADEGVAEIAIETPEDADADIEEPVIEAPEADADVEEPVIEAPEADADIEEPVIEAPEADADIEEPVIEAPEADADVAEPEIEIPVDVDEESDAESEISIPIDTTEPWSDEIETVAADAADTIEEVAADAEDAIEAVSEDVAEAAETVKAEEEKPKESTGFFGRWF
ncbi:MAG: hypothetical protein II483_04365 [Lachnospiraceae bacterium]|nr:hypothetical protein [Lachnospiraceae bacterium]